jgi:hypothetical protein
MEPSPLMASPVLEDGKLGLILPRNCHNLTRIFTPGGVEALEGAYGSQFSTVSLALVKSRPPVVPAVSIAVEEVEAD